MKILVIDDELPIQRLFEQRFRYEISRGNLELIFARSGEEALTKLPDASVVLILSDINMPGMSGLELLRQIRILYPQRPPAVVMITAYSDEQKRRQAALYGADDFLTKPLNFTLLRDRLTDYTTPIKTP
ncbi:response regulator [Nibrella viscosa]|uniref:Response regulator n=1 Tax=Nibrella viscosa TaxID=1084524 RepID=A0ABP8KE63_9BACT